MLYMRISLSASGAGSFDHSDSVSREIRLLSEVEVVRQKMVGSAHQSGSSRCRSETGLLVEFRVAFRSGVSSTTGELDMS